MSGFDEARVELKELQTQYEELSVKVPKLEAEQKAAYDYLMQLKRDVTDAEDQLANVQQEIAKKQLDHRTEVNDKTGELNDLKIEVETYKATTEKQIEREKFDLKDQKTELEEEKNKLDTLLQRYVEDKKALDTDITNFHEQLVKHDKDLKEFNKERKSFEEQKKDLQKDFGKDSIEALRASIERDKQEAVDMTKEAQAKLKHASTMLREAKERNTLVSLKEDEYVRKEELLKEEKLRLSKKEAGLNDRAAVYNSHK